MLDMTGLPGFFDLTVDLAGSDDEASTQKAPPPAVRAKMMLGTGLLPIVQDQLGMKVEGRKLPADVLVIDHVDRIPAEN